MRAVIFAAGLGTRLKPFTEKHPKALALVNNKSLLERNITYLKSFGINEIIINIHHFGDQILELLKENNNFNCEIFISDEREEILETGGGLVKAQALVQEESFVVINADILTDLDLNSLIDFHKEYEPLATLAVSDRDSSRKLFFSQNKQLVGWRNQNTGESIFVENHSEDNSESLAFSGIHIINPKIFPLITQKGKFSIMDTYLELMKKHTILGFSHSSYLIDVGKPEAIQEAEKYFK